MGNLDRRLRTKLDEQRYTVSVFPRSMLGASGTAMCFFCLRAEDSVPLYWGDVDKQFSPLRELVHDTSCTEASACHQSTLVEGKLLHKMMGLWQNVGQKP